MSTNRSFLTSRMLAGLLFAGVVVLGILATSASASHFRGGDINYAQTGSPTSTSADFQSTQSYRCTFYFIS